MENQPENTTRQTTEKQFEIINAKFPPIIRWGRLVSHCFHFSALLAFFGGSYALFFDKPRLHNFFHLPVSNLIYGILSILVGLILVILAQMLMRFSNRLKLWSYTKHIGSLSGGLTSLQNFLKYTGIVFLIFLLFATFIIIFLILAYISKNPF